MLSPEGVRAGAAVAVFVQVQNEWRFAGALSTALPEAPTSYYAETAAGLLAAKFAFDLSKLFHLHTLDSQLEICFRYDSLTVGKHMNGDWHNLSDPTTGRFLRSLFRCLSHRFRACVDCEHVMAHQGEPGNELVDTLAHQAALGSPHHVTRKSFVAHAERFWFLFRTDLAWLDGKLLLPAAPSTNPVPSQISVLTPLETAPGGELVGELAWNVAILVLFFLWSSPNSFAPVNRI